MNKKFFLIIIISFSFMVFEFLLSKELMFLRDIGIQIVIPSVLIGYSIGSALSKISFFKMHFHIKILIAISSAMIISTLVSVHILGFKNFLPWVDFFIRYFVGLGLPFIFFGIYFGKTYSEAEDLRKVFLVNGLGLMLGAIFGGKVFRFMGWEGGILFIYIVLLLFALFFEKGLKKIILLFFFINLLVFIFIFFNLNKCTPRGFSIFASGGKIVKTKNTELVRTDVVKTKNNEYVIFTDGDSPTPIYQYCEGDFTNEIDKNSFTSIPYIIRKYKKVLIIGTGGGEDLERAIKCGASNIVGIELNPSIVSLMKNEFKEYSGGIYLNSIIEIINEEGRSYAQKTKDRYDLIILSGTDTGTTSSLFSCTTLESYLYTKEAINRYWEILSDRGVLFISRACPRSGQDYSRLETLKIYRTIVDGNLFKDIRRHLCVIKTDLKDNGLIAYNILLSKTKFTQNEFNKLSYTSHQILYFPGIKEDIEDIWLENMKIYNLGVNSDNKPTYNYFKYWWQEVAILLPVVFFLVFFTLIICVFKKNIDLRKAAFFVLLGIGYIAIEISITERMLLFLRNPACSVQVVLSSFLLFGGLGGYFGASFKKSRISLYLLILFLTTIIYIGIFNLLYKYQLPNSQLVRIIFSFLIIGPIGFLTAIPFAIALSREEKKHIMYAIDAIGTAAGAFFIFFVHRHFGFNMGFSWAAFIYLMILFFLKGY